MRKLLRSGRCKIERTLPIGIEQPMKMLPPQVRNRSIAISNDTFIGGEECRRAQSVEALLHSAPLGFGEFRHELGVKAEQPRRDRPLGESFTQSADVLKRFSA